MKARQIERDGVPFGPTYEFTIPQWNRMNEIYGEKLRWKAVGKEPTEPKVEYPEDFFKIPTMDELEAMTKTELIEKYNLDPEDKKLLKDEIIEKVVKKL